MRLVTGRLYGRFLHDVRYEDVPPSLERYSLDELLMAAVLTKATRWSYEQEVRLIKQEGSQPANIPAAAIKEIAFGARMPAARVNEIIAAVKAASINARFIQMRFLDDGYGVKPRWITA